MQLQERINAFVQLGKFLGQFSCSSAKASDGAPAESPAKRSGILHNDTFYEGMLLQLEAAKNHNGWFTPDNLSFACHSWSEALSEANIQKWVSTYNFNLVAPKRVAIIMAGNIPLVGFHDFLSVLISGHKVVVKLSSNDRQLLPFLTKYLTAIAPQLDGSISFTENRLQDFDAVIATGSNNTGRYFNHYFGKYPHIIRKNRNSIAVLTGNETKEQMEALADDIFRYFGLGCRNVSKLYIPTDFNKDLFFNGMFSWQRIINNNKYINNYDYNKAVYLMSNFDLLDNEFMLLKEDEGYSSPISVVFYENYSSLDSIEQKLEQDANEIQCIVSTAGLKNEIPFGKAQSPALWDYADNEDTIKFLLEL
ncbi:MAG: hypothetical protein ACI840_000787 [Ulvibacter sp.]|jgi:hypothetical protein